jgi:hypothetical protein
MPTRNHLQTGQDCTPAVSVKPYQQMKTELEEDHQAVKTKKSTTTEAKQQHRKDKIDFSAWKVALSPLASS